mmetsp:Transcript_11776/g.22327  ORF Transcript_11776/g.22327 Transcript_11776/m.22327 type:complete len:469 (+) Transcript_11776:151-1557(+)
MIMTGILHVALLLTLMLGLPKLPISQAFATPSIPQQHQHPNVIISGGGPAGLLASILLNNIGVKSTVFEEAREPDEWSSKSYAMALNERGKAALARAGCLESVIEAGNEKLCNYFVDGATGDVQTIPRREATPGIGLSRPQLVECIENIARDCPLVTLRRGVGVSRVTEEEKDNSRGEGETTGLLTVHLGDGTVISGVTHVVGADGKWSKVRQSFPCLDSQAELVSCTGFGILMCGESAPEAFSSKDGTYVIFPPKDEDSTIPQDFYIIASPLTNGGVALAMVCSDSITRRYPWLKPEADPKPKDVGKGGWKDETSLEKKLLLDDFTKNDLSKNLDVMLQETVPAFHAAVDKSFYENARINRRPTWLQMSATSKDGGRTEEVSYSTERGNVALVGDAAHAMTASMGEGGNCAMESVVKLVDAVGCVMKEKGEMECTVDTMNAGFLKYGVSRPKDVQPIQEMSAARNNK